MKKVTIEKIQRSLNIITIPIMGVVAAWTGGDYTELGTAIVAAENAICEILIFFAK